MHAGQSPTWSCPTTAARATIFCWRPTGRRGRCPASAPRAPSASWLASAEAPARARVMTRGRANGLGLTGLAVQGLLLLGVGAALPGLARLTAAFAALVLLPGWTFGFGVAWNAALVLVLHLAGLPFLSLQVWTLPANAALWGHVAARARGPADARGAGRAPPALAADAALCRPVAPARTHLPSPPGRALRRQHRRHEPDAVMLPVRIFAGGPGQPASLLRFSALRSTGCRVDRSLDQTDLSRSSAQWHVVAPSCYDGRRKVAYYRPGLLSRPRLE